MSRRPARTRRRRRLVKIVAPIVLGTAATAGSAIGLAVGLPLDGSEHLSESKVRRLLPDDVPIEPAFYDFFGSRHSQPGRHLVMLMATHVDAAGREAAFPLYTRIEAGWPVATLAGEIRHVGDLRVSRASVLFLPDVLGSGVLPVIPLVPRWPAFLTSVLWYSLVFYLIFLAPCWFRRRVRRRRGVCLECAYPLGSSAICPECGADAPARKRGL